MDNDTIRVYTDGACSRNGSDKAIAGMGIFFSESDPRNFSARITGKQTNNTAELSAILQVTNILKKEINEKRTIEIYTDSEYALKCCTSYGKKLKSKNWKNGKKSIPNLELVKQTYEVYEHLTNITFHHVRAHTGNTDIHSIGNDGADMLANRAIGVTACPYIDKKKTLQTNTPLKRYINVPYIEKEEAKKLGARWDPKKKKWYFNCDKYEMLSETEQLLIKEKWES